MKISRRGLIAGIFGAGLLALFVGMATGEETVPTQTKVLDNQDVAKSETAVGDLVADAFRSAAHTDVALVSAGDLKPLSSSVSDGGIKAEDVTLLLMYPGDKVVTVALDGGKVLQALETSVASYAQPSLSFLQVSGVKFTFDASRPAGKRVTSATIGGSSIVKDKSYTVAMLNSMAGGALGYWKIWSKRNIVGGTDPITSASAVESYLKANPKPDLTVQGRINPSK